MKSFMLLLNDVRLFQGDGKYLVRVPDKYIAKYSFLTNVGIPVEKVYDHRTQMAYPIEVEDEIYYILAEEMDIEETPLKETVH